LAAGCNPPIAASSPESAASAGATTAAPATAEPASDQPSAEPAASEPAASNAASAESVAPELPAPEAPAPAAAGNDASATGSVQPEAKPKVNRPPRADRLPSKPGEAEKITFDDLNLQMLANIVFRPFMVNDRVRDLEGQRISISGFMHGAAAGLKGVDEFVLLKNTECKFGQDGQADHLARVFLKDGAKANYTRSDIKIEGTLRIEPFTGPDGNTWSIYNIEDAQIR
jgi:hypothetical protein